MMAKQATPKTASVPTLSDASKSSSPGQGTTNAIAGTLEKTPQPPVGADHAAYDARRDGSGYRPFEAREPVEREGEPNSPMRARPASAPPADSSTNFDRLLHAEWARLTGCVSPFALWLAYADWAAHLSAAPGKRQQLIESCALKAIRLLLHYPQLTSDRAGAVFAPSPQDQDRKST